MVTEIPVWTIVLGLIGLLVNLVIGLIAWGINGKLSDLRQTIASLSASDADALRSIRDLSREIAEHKLHVAQTYARSTDVGALFRKIDELRLEMVAEIKDVTEKIQARIERMHSQD